MNFIDIHCHILPGLDDGPPDVEGSLKMLKVAEDDGISALFATPHIVPGLYDNNGSKIIAALEEFRKQVPGAIKMFYGADVRIDADLLERVESGQIPTLNGSGYLLVELPQFIVPPNVDRLIFNLRHKGIVPIITHPERHLRFMQDLRALGRLRDSGALCQITAMSITGGLGREIQLAALDMIEEGMTDFVASDAHDGWKRAPVLSSAYEKVRKKFGQDVSDRLFLANPRKILDAAPPLISRSNS